MGCIAQQHQIVVSRPQTVDDLSGVQSHTAVTGHKELRHTILAQHHDLLRQFHLHFAAGLIFFIEAPRKAHRMLPDNRTAYRFVHFHRSPCLQQYIFVLLGKHLIVLDYTIVTISCQTLSISDRKWRGETV